MKIGFNKPHLTGKEIDYIYEAVHSAHISGNGNFTKKCHAYFENTYGFKKTLLTTSCTDALEMASLLMNIMPGDEVIIPSFTFVSTANAFVLRGAKIVFVDSGSDHPNLWADSLEELITDRTKAIIPVHYAGVACEMDKIMELAQKYNLFIVEDAAQAIDSYYNKKPLGGIGHFGTFSFHETKNIISGEGGMLAVNDESCIIRSEIIWEKGTNRSQFFRGEVDKYGWVDIGSSYLPSEIISAFLYAQLECIQPIQAKRKAIWNYYYKGLQRLQERGNIKLPVIPAYATNNAHIFYLLCNSSQDRTGLIRFLKDNQVDAVFHYLPLHKSPFYAGKHDGRILPNSERFAETLVRLPLYYELSEGNQDKIITLVERFFDE